MVRWRLGGKVLTSGQNSPGPQSHSAQREAQPAQSLPPPAACLKPTRPASNAPIPGTPPRVRYRMLSSPIRGVRRALGEWAGVSCASSSESLHDPQFDSELLMPE